MKEKLTIVGKCRACRGTGKQTVANHKEMRARREKKRITVRGMAKRIGVSAPFLSDIENAVRPCPNYVLKYYQRL